MNIVSTIIKPYSNKIKLIIYAVIAAAVLAIVGYSVWVYKDWQYQKAENKRKLENSYQARKADSLKYTTQLMDKDELNTYLESQNKDLSSKLKKDNINYKKIQSIISQTFKYIDTTRKETDVSGIINAIDAKIPKSQVWLDTTKCQFTKGLVIYDGINLKVVVTERGFNNISNAVAFEERRLWKLLWFKTRFLGKKQTTSVTYDECGETKTLKIEAKKD